MKSTLEAGWPAPARVRTLVTTRAGGVSSGAWSSQNLGTRCGDDPVAVTENQSRVRALLPSSPKWLKQVHGSRVIQYESAGEDAEADAIFTRGCDRVCAVLTADCLPVLICSTSGDAVAAVHAGWRGLAAGVLEKAVRAIGTNPQKLMAWLGPAISQAHYQVGTEVRDVFVGRDRRAEAAFQQDGERWRADLYALARMRLASAGVDAIYGGEYCTYTQAEKFYSYRRDGRTGRFGSFIWIDPPD